MAPGDVRSSQKPQAILVMGMHRSGTSALAGAIHALGVAAPKTLLPAMPDNPRGFWESQPLVEVHDQLLAAAGSSWSDWRQLNARWNQSIATAPYREKIKQVVTDEFGGHMLFVIKDPRICRFPQFFTSILTEMGIGLSALLPVRNPLEVAYSLNRRDGVALPKSLLLWLRSVLDAEYATRGMPRCFIAYEKMLIDWRRELTRASDIIGVAWPARSAMTDAKLDTFLTHDLHRERATADDVLKHPDIPSWISETYRILSLFAADGESENLVNSLDCIRTAFDESAAIFGSVLAAEELAAERARARLESHHQELRAGQQRLSELLERAGAEAADLRAAVASALEANQQLKVEIKLQSDTDRERIAGALRERDSANAALGAILSSRSWRMTGPARNFLDWLRRLSQRAGASFS